MIAGTNVISSTGPGRPQRPYPGPYAPSPQYPRYPQYPTPYPRPYPGPYAPRPEYPRYPQYPTPYPAPNYPQYPMPNYPQYPTPEYPQYPTPNYPNYPVPSNPGYPNYPVPSEPGYPTPSPNYPSPSYPSPTPSYPSPGTGVGNLRADVQRATSSLQDSLSILGRIPANDRGSEATKQARLAAFHANRAAQDLLEANFGVREPSVLSTLRAADASLEDAAWQLARKPSPDGRFNGVDIPGAVRDTRAAVDLLARLLRG